ncbi:unnamed protein product [Trypanosoma congolense IL3000]|uniref:WGS project CAEQ00000000 data, annotated contig 725 n=1 Tax=Trypanosoma congolense (strain IL3000) TaxID=1068625 RepID=F9WI32_TRYCI|nr:unnamed protein product [Trypanosoma congolense IL3000]
MMGRVAANTGKKAEKAASHLRSKKPQQKGSRVPKRRILGKVARGAVVGKGSMVATDGKSTCVSTASLNTVKNKRGKRCTHVPLKVALQSGEVQPDAPSNDNSQGVTTRSNVVLKGGRGRGRRLAGTEPVVPHDKVEVSNASAATKKPSAQTFEEADKSAGVGVAPVQRNIGGAITLNCFVSESDADRKVFRLPLIMDGGHLGKCGGEPPKPVPSDTPPEEREASVGKRGNMSSAASVPQQDGVPREDTETAKSSGNVPTNVNENSVVVNEEVTPLSRQQELMQIPADRLALYVRLAESGLDAADRPFVACVVKHAQTMVSAWASEFAV